MRRGIARIVLGLAILCMWIAGCGKSVGNIKGKVYYKDTALNAGLVTFHGDKAARSATIQEDGSYVVKGMPGGEATITVTTAAAGSTSAGNSKKVVQLPPELADPKKSKEKYTVKAGDQDYDVYLK
jgi:hypothetical protein